MVEKWTKDCDCKSTSTSGKIRSTETKTDSGVNIDFIFYPQPSCDKCGVPWELIDEEITVEECGNE